MACRYSSLTLTAFILAALLISACGVSSAKSESEALCAKYFEDVQKGTLREVLPLYGDEFYKVTSKEEWIKILEKIREKLGRIQAHNLVNWNVKVQANTFGSGTFVTLVYDVKYTSYDAQEAFLVLKPLTGGPAKIIGHHINSKGLILQ
jgi:hypothetical protein